MQNLGPSARGRLPFSCFYRCSSVFIGGSNGFLILLLLFLCGSLCPLRSSSLAPWPQHPAPVRGGDALKLVSFGVFGLSMIALYAASTLFHSARGPAKERCCLLYTSPSPRD